MKRTTIGYLLIAGAVGVWAFNYYQQSAAIGDGTITDQQGLTMADRIFSPAGVALVAGIYLAWPNLKTKVGM